MNDVDDLRALLKAALPPTAGDAAARDLWPRVRERMDSRPLWSMLDVALAAAAAVALWLVPDVWLALLYHL